MALQLVSTVTVGSGGAASIEWSGIAGTGKDLLILVSGRNSAGDQIALTLNSDTTNANYSRRLLTGYNGGVTSTSASARPTIRIVDNTQTASTFSNNLIYITNYTSSVAKSISIDNVDEGNNAFVNTEIVAASWSGTSAITTVTLAILGGTIVQHTTASLYIIS